MITAYHRPKDIDEALALLARAEPATYPLAGGTKLNQPSKQSFEVVDLQALGLDTVQAGGKSLELGATLTLQRLLDYTEQDKPAGLQAALTKAIKHEASYNLRQTATVAGTLVAADGRSPFTAAALALEVTLALQPGDENISLGDLLLLRREHLKGRLITRLYFPLNVRLAYEYVARTPADLPIVCAAVAAWPSGRTRLALGGFGDAPRLAFDGSGPDGLVTAAESAYSMAGDEWASAEYRSEIAGVLAGRCLEQIEKASD